MKHARIGRSGARQEDARPKIDTDGPAEQHQEHANQEFSRLVRITETGGHHELPAHELSVDADAVANDVVKQPRIAGAAFHRLASRATRAGGVPERVNVSSVYLFRRLERETRDRR